MWFPARVVYSRSGVRDAWTCLLLGGGIGVGLLGTASYAPFSGQLVFGMGMAILAGAFFLGWRHGTSRVEVGEEGFVVFSRWGARAFRWADVADVHAVVMQDLSGRDSYAARLTGGEWSESDAVLGLLVRRRESGRVIPVEVHEPEAVAAIGEYWRGYLQGFSGPLHLP